VSDYTRKNTRSVSRQRRWLGSFSLPFTTIYLNTAVEGERERDKDGDIEEEQEDGDDDDEMTIVMMILMMRDIGVLNILVSLSFHSPLYLSLRIPPCGSSTD